MKRVLLSPPSKDNEQVQAYVTAVQRGLKSYYIVYHDGAWTVHRPLGKRLEINFSTKAMAVSYSLQQARKRHADLFIFNQDGTMDTINRYYHPELPRLASIINR